MRYTIRALDVEVLWPKDFQVDWEPWVERLKSLADHKVSYDSEKQAGRVVSPNMVGNFGPLGFGASLRVLKGTRRDTILKQAQELLTSVMSVGPNVSPYLSVDFRLEATLPESWKGPLRQAVEAFRVQPWVNEGEEIDFVGVRYYIRSTEDESLAMLDIVPGFVRPTLALVKLEVFHAEAHEASPADMVRCVNRILKVDVPKLIGV